MVAATISRKPGAARDARPTVLLTGFEPFGGEDINPSWLLAQALHGRQIAGHRIQAARLPTVFGAAADLLARRVHAQRPALVLCLGLAGGRAALSVERVAINIDDARIADNARARPVDRPVVAGAPAAYFARLPIKAMAHAMHATGVPTEVSNSAGTFVCNHVFYALMHLLATGRGLRRIQGGFVHLPWLPEQARTQGSTHGMALEDMTRAVHAGLKAVLRHHGKADLALGAGRLH